jgi:hypothetical protein
MDMYSRIVMVVKKGDNEYTFCMPFNAPAGEAYDAAFEVLDKIVDMAKTSKEKMKRQEETTTAT